MPIGLLNMIDKQPLGAGYYRLADIPPPWGLPADVKLRLHWMELIHRTEVQVAQGGGLRPTGLPRPSIKRSCGGGG